MIQHQTGVDLTAAAVHGAVDRGFQLPVPQQAPPVRYHGTWIIPAPRPGALRSIRLAPELAPHLLEEIYYKHPGAAVRRFQTSGDALGILLMQFASAGEMQHIMGRMNELCTVEIDD
jgi:hypothetical protein